MMQLISILGVIGALVFGVIGVMRGDAGQYERIVAICCVAMAAAGFVGVKARSPMLHHVPPRRVGISLGDLFSAVAIAPVAALCLGVFLLTMIPSIYVMLPVLLVWWAAREVHRPQRIEPTPAPGPLPEPVVV